MPGLVESFSAKTGKRIQDQRKVAVKFSKMDFLSYLIFNSTSLWKSPSKKIQKKNTQPNGFHQVRWEASYHNHMEIENCAICKASVKPCKKKKTYNIRSPAPSNGCQFDPKGCWIDTLFGTIWHALKDLLDRRNPDPLSSKQKRQLQPAALKSGYLSRNLPKKQTSKGKKKERNFQPLQSDHYGLLEVNQPVPLPRIWNDGFPHGDPTIFVHQIFIPK